MDTKFEILRKIPKVDGRTTVFDCNHGRAMVYCGETDVRAYSDYAEKLADAGYTCYQENELRGNRHATYVSEDAVVQLYYVPCERVLRIAADPNINLFEIRQRRAEYARKTMLYQMELDYRTINCGMCCVVRCDDGSFFVIDSAHMNSVNDHIRIHDLLKKLNGDNETIRIAGWFLTHAHQDHIVKFMDFVEYGFDDYVIEKVYYNFPELHIPGSEKWSDGDKATMREFDAFMEKHKELTAVTLHTGQRFFVRNLQFDVLATHEDIYPGTMARFNNSSTVLLMEAEGEKVLWLGDAGTEESNILERRYGDLLKAKIVQVAHHGFSGATTAVYELAGAEVSLFATDRKHYEANIYREPNQKVIALSKEVYIASEGTVEFELPYMLGTARVWKKEIED